MGEGVVSSTKVKVVKTHFPERRGFPTYQASQAILLVRNPWDAIDSYWNLNLTNTHTESVIDDVYEKFARKWQGLARNEMEIWLRFHQYWLASPIPLLVIRFEDLVACPQRELGRILGFILGQETLPDFWKDRIRRACDVSSSCRMGSYRPRSATGGTHSLGKSLRKGHFSDSLRKELHEICRRPEYRYNETPLLQWFGYDVEAQNFPSNFLQGRAPVLHRTNPSVATKVHINEGPMVRPDDNPYGRPMRAWRRSHTNNDTEPFPTVSRNQSS